MSFATDLDQHVAALTAQFQAALVDGCDLNDVLGIVLGGAMALTQMAQQYQQMPAAKKQRAIVQALKRVYLSRQVDVPWVPEPFETMLESMLFTVVLPELVKLLLAPRPATA